MSHSKHRSKGKQIANCILAFVLAFVLFILGVLCVVRLTVFSKDFMSSVMSSSDYSNMIKLEFKEELRSLGHASGLDEDFVEKFTDSLDFTVIEENYISAFYRNESTLVDTISFKQEFLQAIENYITENNFDRSKATEEDIAYLTNEAADIYVNVVSIPFFSTIANYIVNAEGPLNGAIIGLAIAAVIIGAIICVGNEYKHRKFRYLTYAFLTAGITTTVIPAVVFATGYIERVNFATRSMYNIFVNYFNTMFSYFWIFVGIYFFTAACLFFIYLVSYKKANKHAHH